MNPRLPANKPDLQLRTIERFARFCMDWVERLLCLEPLSRSTDKHSNAGPIGRPNITLIAAITRLTAVAAMLMRYVEKPRALRCQTDARSGIHMAYGSFTEPNPGLPLGHDALSETVRTVCAKAHQMIRRDQFYRFGNPHYIDNKDTPEVAPQTDEVRHTTR